MDNNQMYNHQDIKQLGKVAVLFGGNSSEREVSLLSGERIYAALQKQNVQCCLIDAADRLVEKLLTYKPDCAFIVLHGKKGEDGTVQGLLECMEIPYTGSDVSSSALAMDKYRSKLLWQSVGLPTPPFQLIASPDDMEYCYSLFPVFVKPSKEGSSLGMSRVYKEEDLFKAWTLASKYNGSVLVEQLIDGPEFSVSILNGQALPTIRIDTGEGFYDYNAKYFSKDTQYTMPCGLSKSQEQELQAIALTAFEVLGCSGFGRVDFIQDKKGRFWLLEANTIPGMTSHSLVPMAAQQAGISFDDLILRILQSLPD